MKITADYPLYNNLIGKLDGEKILEYLKQQDVKLWKLREVKE